MNDAKIICQYAVVQFAPYRATGEFVNAGVVLLCVDVAFFDFRLQRGEPRRVLDFFPELPPHVYRQAMEDVARGLKVIASAMNIADRRGDHRPSLANQELMRRMFDTLVQDRESMTRFGAMRSVQTDDPARELARQYNLHVDRAYTEPGMVAYALE